MAQIEGQVAKALEVSKTKDTDVTQLYGIAHSYVLYPRLGFLA